MKRYYPMVTSVYLNCLSKDVCQVWITPLHSHILSLFMHEQDTSMCHRHLSLFV